MKRGRDAGNAALGFAVAGPFVAFILVLVINLAAAIWQRELVAHETLAAIRQSTLAQDGSAADRVLADRLNALGLTGVDISHSDSWLASGGVVRSVSVRFVPRMSLPLPGRQLSIHVVGMVEP